jgi:hypothetical protein
MSQACQNLPFSSFSILPGGNSGNGVIFYGLKYISISVKNNTQYAVTNEIASQHKIKEKSKDDRAVVEKIEKGVKAHTPK